MADSVTFPDEPHAPGCFGSALTYRAETPECRDCPFAATCAPASEQRRKALATRFGLPEPKPKRPAPAKAEKSKATPTGLSVPVKVEALLQKFASRGLAVSADLAEGRNPFEVGFPFMKITTHLLLLHADGIERKLLAQVLEKKLNWGAGTAAAHALQASQALCALGVAEETNGRIKLRKHQ